MATIFDLPITFDVVTGNLLANAETSASGTIRPVYDNEILNLKLFPVRQSGSPGQRWIYAPPTIGAASDITVEMVDPDGGTPYISSNSFAAVDDKTITTEEIVAGAANTNEVQRITFDSVAFGGSYVLSLSTDRTTSIAYDADAATVQAALEALAGIGPAGCAVTGDRFAGFIVEFVGANAGTAFANIAGDGSGLLVPSGHEGEFDCTSSTGHDFDSNGNLETNIEVKYTISGEVRIFRFAITFRNA